MIKDRFSPVKHIPKYSYQLWRTVRTPVVVYFALLGQVILFSSISLFHYYESQVNPAVNSWLDSFWWGIVTMTTVGYGDIVPQTTEGRFIAITLIILGVALFVSFTALFVSVLFNITSEEIEHQTRLTFKEFEALMSEIKDLKDQVASLKK